VEAQVSSRLISWEVNLTKHILIRRFRTNHNCTIVP
jgi:hypothetical protein